MNIEQARFNMVEQQIRPWDVLDPNVLNLLFEVKREEFVPPAYRTLAFADLELPIGQGQTMLPPRVEARLLQGLSVQKTDRVLEIGTGTGYMAALLAACAAEVVTVEQSAELAATAKANLKAAGVMNVTVEVGDGLNGWSAGAPYDVILVSGAMVDVPDALLQQLRVGGRMAVIVGYEPVMTAQIITCTEEGLFSAVDFFETVVAPLQGVPTEPAFVF